MKKLILIALMVSAIIVTGCAPVLVGGAIVSGISVANDRRSAGQVIDDKIISAQVRKDIYSDISNSKHIKIMTYNGIVLLVGEASSASDKTKAEDIAAVKNGVIRVINELEETIPSTFTRRSKDSYITTKAKSSLLRIKIEGFNPSRVRIITTRGNVYLMGRVSEKEAKAVVEKIRNLRGVRKVIKVFEYI